MEDRWATFDCYGTLIDWNAGIRRELARVFGDAQAEELLERYHRIEPELEAHGRLAYREVMTEAMRRLGAPSGEAEGLARSLPFWEPFPEVPASLAEMRRRGWRLAILSNTDRDLLDASMERLGVPFDHSVVAGEIGSYKPAHRHWECFFHETGADPARHVHVARSHPHDIVPAHDLGLRSVWINRDRDRAEPPPTRELPDLSSLVDTLDELVAA